MTRLITCPICDHVYTSRAPCVTTDLEPESVFGGAYVASTKANGATKREEIAIQVARLFLSDTAGAETDETLLEFLRGNPLMWARRSFAMADMIMARERAAFYEGVTAAGKLAQNAERGP